MVRGTRAHILLGKGHPLAPGAYTPLSPSTKSRSPRSPRLTQRRAVTASGNIFGLTRNSTPDRSGAPRSSCLPLSLLPTSMLFPGTAEGRRPAKWGYSKFISGEKVHSFPLWKDGYFSQRKICMVILHLLYKLIAFYVQHRNKYRTLCVCVCEYKNNHTT